MAAILLSFLALAPQGGLAQDHWLLGTTPHEATVRVEERRDGARLHLENGLVRRSFVLAPNAACYAFDNLMTGASMLRAIRPEAALVVDGRTIDVGGLIGQPNHAFLTEEWLGRMTSDPSSMTFTGYEISEPAERLAWPRDHHHAPDAVWPPAGVALRLDFAPGPGAARGALMHERSLRPALMVDELEALGPGWRVRTTSGDRSVLMNEGKVGEVRASANHAAYLERPAPEGTALLAAVLDPGTDSSATWGPGIAVVFPDRTVKFNLRPGKRGFGVWDGRRELVDDGGHDMSQPWELRVYLEPERILCAARPRGPGAASGEWLEVFELEPTNAAPSTIRVGKMDRAGEATGFSEEGASGRCRLVSLEVRGGIDEDSLARAAAADPHRGLRVSIHYELYDGIPLVGKRVVLRNDGDRPLEIDRLTGELLAVVESRSWVEVRDGASMPPPEHFHVETDYAFGGMVPENAQAQIVHWRADPEFHTQVNYLKSTPCQLEVEPLHGPDLILEPGDELEGWWTFELVHGDTDRELRSMAQRRMYRTLAPWVTENPLILHVVSTDADVVERAIDQAAECGFEMVSLSFGSGLNMEDDRASNHARFRELSRYAAERGIRLGGYSLLASRRIQPDGDNAINVETGEPGGQTFGFAPALASAWGQEYFRRLRAFFEETGFMQFTHDGSYPGDRDAAARPPLQRGYEDSQWVQWRIITSFYRWLRARGVYLRVPDFYYLQGANECGMGYREVNWSLPRAQQVIHTRQNIYDGTWTKTPSLGWMFVPLTQYHGGGAAATIEPLDEHLDHYERMLASNLGLGVQAVYRGHRLYDTPRVREAVKAWVNWYKHHRHILESDVVHGRRADGRDVDWMLHVNPGLQTRGMLVAYNPLDQPAARTIRVPLGLTGLRGDVRVETNSGPTTDAARAAVRS
ncbi:MAG: hypothetical protein VX460_12835, partial [Planctomycetota bacterium]|nr:hypothetical protein [Planctomycetota bacterium]